MGNFLYVNMITLQTIKVSLDHYFKFSLAVYTI